MEYTEKYFKEKTKNVTFIEFKKGTSFNVKNYVFEGDIPLPVITDNLIQEVKEGNLKEEIPLSSIIEGMIYVLGVDRDFIHLNEYKEILNSYDSEINSYIFYKGMKAMEDGDMDTASIYFRALLVLEPKNVNGLFNYAIALEEIAKKLIQKEKTEEGNGILMSSTNQFEAILDVDDKFSLAYYKLGYHYKYLGQNLKAKIIWSKFLILDDEDSRIQEIREELSFIEDDVKMESGLSYLTYNEFGKALDQFLKLLPTYDDNWNVNYLIGTCYKGLEEYDSAIEYLTTAMNLNKEEPDVYNELGILFFSIGDIVKAVKVFKDGIDNCEDDYKLYFNRGLGYVQLGQYELALEDINTAYTLNPYDENISLYMEEIQKLIDSI